MWMEISNSEKCGYSYLLSSSLRGGKLYTESQVLVEPGMQNPKVKSKLFTSFNEKEKKRGKEKRKNKGSMWMIPETVNKMCEHKKESLLGHGSSGVRSF